MKKVQVVILCGGEGSRVKHITGAIPKCVFDINGKPFLSYMIDHLSQFNEVSEFLLCCSDKSLQIAKYLMDYYGFLLESLNKPIRLITEPKPTGTFSGMLSALPFVNTKYVLVMNGDTFCPINISDLFQFHKLHRYTRVSVAYSGNVHSGIWLMHSEYLQALIELNPRIKREELLPSGCRIDVPYDECAWIFRYYDAPPFIDIGTPEGMREAMEKL